MAYRTKAYFLAKFIANYTVQHEDMTDLADSALFYSDDVGYRSTGTVIIQPQTYPATLDLSSFTLLKAPIFIGPELTDLNLSDNVLTSFFLSPTLINLQTLNLSFNTLPSITVPPELVSLVTINFSSNSITSVTLPVTLIALTTLDLTANDLDITAVSLILVAVANSGAACAIDLSGGSNAAKSTWNPAALAAEAQIVINGGSVASNP